MVAGKEGLASSNCLGVPSEALMPMSCSCASAYMNTDVRLHLGDKISSSRCSIVRKARDAQRSTAFAWLVGQSAIVPSAT